jgi:hypothetical protein
MLQSCLSTNPILRYPLKTHFNQISCILNILITVSSNFIQRRYYVAQINRLEVFIPLHKLNDWSFND